MTSWALLHIHKWISESGDDCVLQGPVIALGYTGGMGDYDINEDDILEGRATHWMTYVQEDDGDVYEIIDPADWPDHVCATIAKRMLTDG